MKKTCTIFAIVAAFFIPLSIHAQGIYQFWGTTTAGGKDDLGSFFSTKYDGTAQRNKSWFVTANSGRSWEGSQPVPYNGKFYSLLQYGGLNDDGIISEYDPATGVYTTRANMYNLETGSAINSLVLAGNKLYGISGSSGILKPARLFEFDPAGGSLVSKHIFTEATGIGSQQEPVLFNNKLYGMTSQGGNDNQGVIYEFDPVTGAYTVKYHFSGNMAGSNFSGFTVYAGKLWSIELGGMLFSYDPVTNVLSPKQDLSSIAGTTMDGQMAVLNNRLYGVSASGGPGDDGFIFEYNPANNTLTVEMDFTAGTVNNRFTLLSYNGLLYGASLFGGLHGQGALFSYNPVTNTYNSIKAFNDAEGGGGEGRITLYNNKLYGWLLNGGYSSGTSSLFEYNPANNQFAIKLSLGGDELTKPQGELMYYKNKLYGAATNGGTLKGGGIYAFDLQTQTFETKVEMATTTGKFSDQGGFLLYNNKFYAVASNGGLNGKGTLFQYDPDNNEYTQLVNFGGPLGDNPYGQLILFNGKIYGTCREGGTSDAGTLFEFNPVTNVVTTKVAFHAGIGGGPACALTVYNGRLFGVTGYGGASNDGVLFEYLPLPNGVVKLAEFKSNITGSAPVSALIGYDNKLWGVTEGSNLGPYLGFFYAYDLATGTLSKKRELVTSTGYGAIGGMILHNNKFYGMTNVGGSGYEGVLYEYDPAGNNYSVKIDFEPASGKWARRTNLAKVPAPTAPGSAGSCTNTQTININAANANQWIAFTDAEGRAVAEINANGNILGNTAVRVFVNGGNIRQNNNGLFYLDRNITISSANAPASAVSIRLYIRKTEFESLKATAGSGIVVPGDLVIYNNNDFCTPVMNTAALPLTTTKEDWGFDYVYSADVTSFSSFYFAKMSGAVPVKLLSFSGMGQNNVNKLEWKSVCTNNVDFIIERSSDGIHFDSIGIKKALQTDCDHPFVFIDETPGAISYYRLKLAEDNGNISYSNIVLLQQKNSSPLSIVIMPNPVQGSEAMLKITAAQSQKLSLNISDVTGRKILQTKVNVNTGVQLIKLPLPAMPAGMYYLQYSNEQTQHSIKMLKQ